MCHLNNKILSNLINSALIWEKNASGKLYLPYNLKYLKGESNIPVNFNGPTVTDVLNVSIDFS